MEILFTKAGKLAANLPQFKFNRYPDPTAHELRRLIAEANARMIALDSGWDATRLRRLAPA